MSSSLQVGLRCARHYACRGPCCGGCCCYAKAGTAEGRAHKKTTTLQHNKRAASLRWGFAALATTPAGVPAAVDPAAAMPQPARPKAGPTKDNNTAAQQKSSSLQVGLRCARQCALRGAAAGLLEHRINNTAAQQKSSSLQVGLRCARQCALRGAAAVDFAAAAAVINPDSRPVPERWILPPLLLSSHVCSAAARRSPWEESRRRCRR